MFKSGQMLINRQHQMKYPNWVTLELTSHFIRGFFDVDGTINYCKTADYYTFSIIYASHDFIDVIKNILEELCSDKLNVFIYKGCKRITNRNLSITYTKFCIKMLNYIQKENVTNSKILGYGSQKTQTGILEFVNSISLKDK